MNRTAQNIRYSLRLFRKNPAFTITAILTLAIGIGANIAVFSVMNAVLLNPSGIPHPDRIVALRAKYAYGDLTNISMSSPDLGDAASATNLLAATAAARPGQFNYVPNGNTPIRINASRVTYKWFDVFEASPILGRTFREEEDRPNATNEVILSYGTWKNVFGADKSIVGRKITLNEQPFEVVGVMGADFDWPNMAEMWTPLGLDPAKFHDENDRFNENLFSVGRMRDGVSVSQVNAFLGQRAAAVAAAAGPNSYALRSGWGMFSMPLVEYVSGDLRKPLSVLITAVVLVLLIACANIAGLQLARASGRQREVSIQIALGASRARLMEQAFTESALLAIGGAVLGIFLAGIGIPALLAIAPPSLASNLIVKIDRPVLLYVTGVAVLCAILCGIAPAWQLTHVRWFQALQEGGRSETLSKARQRLRSALVISEIAIAVLLLTSAGLLVRSLDRLETVQTGFEPKQMLSAIVSLPRTKYKETADQAAFYSAVEQQLRNRPGISDVAIADCVPFVNLCGSASFGITGRPTGPNDPGPHGYIRSVSPDYFSALKIPLIRGRAFTESDRKASQQVAMIDETLAKRYWPGKDPIGEHIVLDDKIPPSEIVGIVAPIRNSSLESEGSEGFYFVPLAQYPDSTASIAVRTSLSNPTSLGSVIQDAVRAVDSNQPIYDIKTMQQRVNDSLIGRRFLVVLLSTFAGIALLLSSLGLYGVINYGVKLRVREIGIRMALGAQRGDVLRMILNQGVRLAIVGLSCGLVSVFIAGRTLSSLLYQVSLFNPLTLIVTSILLSATVLLASYLPARRAAQLDPMRTLREE
jgi:predicted permease